MFLRRYLTIFTRFILYFCGTLSLILAVKEQHAIKVGIWMVFDPTNSGPSWALQFFTWTLQLSCSTPVLHRCVPLSAINLDSTTTVVINKYPKTWRVTIRCSVFVFQKYHMQEQQPWNYNLGGSEDFQGKVMRQLDYYIPTWRTTNLFFWQFARGKLSYCHLDTCSYICFRKQVNREETSLV